MPELMSWGRAAAGLLGAALVSVAARHEKVLAPLDRGIRVPAPHTELSRRAWQAVTVLGSRPVAYTATATRCLRCPKGRTRRSALDRWLPLAVLAAGDVTRTAICRAVGRQRPPLAGRFASFHGASYPSRHTATALLATGLVTGSGTAAYGVGCAVGLSRLALRVHWPTDVLGGWLFGYGWLAAARIARTAPAPDLTARSPHPPGARHRPPADAVR
ncbi:phosphatase PAP2 family protein [Streptomyces murinus]|uniref:Membrane-associated phospholipid phosphatase n=1 Tax=Streptomyces murinus TaxID=33900 RepID=A0A7W3NW14_STRMR|nr:phosphatase PAP2 family protein [Streptomyces murinus]MBA9057769.1 membrane-associated phospholipid phosphatase [Streptomyces murinus]